MQNYGQKIKEIRAALGISQRELAELIDSNRDIINSYEHSRARVTAEAWEKIKALLLVTAPSQNQQSQPANQDS